MASKAANLIAEIQAQYPGASLKGNGRGRKHLDFALPDGRSVYVGVIDDLHFKDGLDQWQEVDESLTDDGADGFAKKCDKTRHTLRLGTGGTRRWYPRREVATEYVDITASDYWDANKKPRPDWRPINLPAAVWKTQGAEWDMANMYASVTNTWRRVKADFLLKDSTAPTRLRFAVTLVGLTLGADWHLTSTTDAVDVGSIDPPTAQDANEANVPVTATYAGGYIEWAADTTGAAYPVTVDPTFTDGYGGDVTTAKDTFCIPETPDSRSGATSIELNVKMLTGIIGDYDFSCNLLEFDLSSLSGVTISSRTLTLGRTQQCWGVATLYIARMLCAWQEDCSWDYRLYSPDTRWPGDAGSNGGADAGATQSGTDFSSTAMASVSLSDGRTAGTYDVSLGESEFANMVSANYGLRLYVSSSVEILASSDHATTGYRPKLVVVYTAGGSPSNTPSASASSSPSATPSATPSGSPSQGTPSVSPSNTPSSSPSEGTPSSSPSNTPSSSPSEGTGSASPSATPSSSPSEGTPSGSPSNTPSTSPSQGTPSSSPSQGTPSSSPSQGTPSGSPSATPSSSPSEGTPSASPCASPALPDICWGHVTGVTEDNARTFAGNWTGTGAITGAGDSERVELNAGEYVESEFVNTGAALVTLLYNHYQAGDTVILAYRTAATQALCEVASWVPYGSPFNSAGIVQLRLEVSA